MVNIIDKQNIIRKRGERIKRARNMANLSRDQMCANGCININTLKGWELGKHGGLTKDGAKKIITRLAEENVVCSIEWLMTGTENPPHPAKFYTNDTLHLPFQFNSDEESIINELKYFCAINEHKTNTLKVLDNSMSPQYCLGDYVAGIKISKDNFKICINKTCIVETISGNKLLRLVKQSDTANKVTLIAINKDYDQPDKLIDSIELSSCAPVIWHRKPKLLQDAKRAKPC